MLIIIAIAAVSVLIAGGFLFSLIWALRSGQFDDQYGAARRMLFDEQDKNSKKISQ